MEKRAQQRLYRINLGAMVELEDWVGRLTQFWTERFDALDEVLQAEKRKT